MTKPEPHQQLLERVAQRLGEMSTANDHLLLVQWKVIGLCQQLLGSQGTDTERLIIEALDVFCCEGASAETDRAILRAVEGIAQTTKTSGDSVFPSIAQAKREEVLAQLKDYEAMGSEAVRRSLRCLPLLRDRLLNTTAGALLAGMRHRLELVATIAADANRAEEECIRAATAILYLDELHDAIPDTLGHIGLLDDDFALRTVLEELGEESEDKRLHWAERISALWDDLPFLRGVQLKSARGPVVTTWLDRINSYVSYAHALDGEGKTLVLVQPSVECSPIHAIVSLIGLLVFDGITSSKDLLQSLQEGQIYEIDGKFYARFDGFSGPPWPGWLRLNFREGTIFGPPTVADRMVATQERRLSLSKEFSTQLHSEPIQQFFNWGEAIGAASISSRVLLVTSRQRARKMFDGISSNGIRLLDDDLIRFAGLTPDPDVLRGGLVLVVPNLTVARQLVDHGVDVHAIVVDGYERLHRGRHDLPFLMKRSSPPPLIVWTPTGYYPSEPPAWLPDHRHLHVSSEDLSCILELEGDIDDQMVPGRASLWAAATRPGVTKLLVVTSHEEQRLLDTIEGFLNAVRRAPEIPEHWQYHLNSTANALRILAAATPAYWSDVRELATSWRVYFEEQWATLRTRAAEALAHVAKAHQDIFECLTQINAKRNTKADALLDLVTDEPGESWRLICDRLDQMKVVGRLARQASISGLEPVLLRDLEVCRSCIVVGWRNVSFAQRLWAHTPRRLVGLVDENEGQHWDKVEAQASDCQGDSLLEAVGYRPQQHALLATVLQKENLPSPGVDAHADEAALSGDQEARVSCVFIWLADEPEGKVLARDNRVLLEVGARARERLARLIKPDDRVILGTGSSRWSPADEFTRAVLKTIEASHPDLIRDVKEWRRALCKLINDKRWSLEDLRSSLERIGVYRGPQTLAGWLYLDQSSPIGPRHIQKEINAIWDLVGDTYTERTADEVAAACMKLRSLRSVAGRVLLELWKGHTADIGVEESLLNELVRELRQEVQVHEVETVTFGEVPESMIGWWVTPEVSAPFENGSCSSHLDVEQDGPELSEDDCD